jgi:hypothetical protein
VSRSRWRASRGKSWAAVTRYSITAISTDSGGDQHPAGRGEGSSSEPRPWTRVGDCFDLNDGPDVEEVGEIRAIPCNEPHTFEAYFATDLAAGPYPARDGLDAVLDAACLPSFETYVGRDYETSQLYVTSFEPTPDPDRNVTPSPSGGTIGR